MSESNLKLRTSVQYTITNVTLGTLAQWWRDEKLYPTPWQRGPRWKKNRDPAEWVSCVLQNTPVIPLFVHQQPNADASDFEYRIIDGQNRSESAFQFILEHTVKVRAGDVLHQTLAPDALLAFTDFSPAQQQVICNIPIPMCVFSPATTEDELRRVFRNLNMGKMLTSHEIIHSWVHVPIVNELLNVADARYRGRILGISRSWRPDHLRMMHTWVRIAALMFSDFLHLGTADRLEQWVSRREFVPVPPADAEHFYRVVDCTLRVLEAWREHGPVPSLSTVPDIAWAFVAFPEQLADAMLTVMQGTVLHTIHNEFGMLKSWTHSPGILQIDAVRERRVFLSRLIREDLQCGAPREFARAFADQPIGASTTAPPTQDDLDAAEALMDLMPRPQPLAQRPAVLDNWLPVF